MTRLKAVDEQILAILIEAEDTPRRPQPSYRELVELTGLASTSVVVYHVNALKKRGYVVDGDNVYRSLFASEEGRAYFTPEKPKPVR